MINFDRFKTALAIAFVGLLLAVLIFTFLTLPGGVGRPRGFSGESLFVVLSVALAMIIGGATVATGVQAIFTQSSPRGGSSLGDAFQQNLRVFAWIVGSISASYTVVTIAERLIDALLAAG